MTSIFIFSGKCCNKDRCFIVAILQHSGRSISYKQSGTRKKPSFCQGITKDWLSLSSGSIYHNSHHHYGKGIFPYLCLTCYFLPPFAKFNRCNLSIAAESQMKHINTSGSTYYLSFMNWRMVRTDTSILSTWDSPQRGFVYLRKFNRCWTINLLLAHLCLQQHFI